MNKECAATPDKALSDSVRSKFRRAAGTSSSENDSRSACGLTEPSCTVNAFSVRPAKPGEEALYARLAHELWPEGKESEHMEEAKEIFSSGTDQVFFAERNGIAVGFCHTSLRTDYVEGAECSPTGYLEGIYVSPACRHTGIARALLSAAESWAKTQGAEAFASDCEITNLTSQRFHETLGFTETNRIVCYIKKLK